MGWPDSPRLGYKVTSRAWKIISTSSLSFRRRRWTRMGARCSWRPRKKNQLLEIVVLVFSGYCIWEGPRYAYMPEVPKASFSGASPSHTCEQAQKGRHWTLLRVIENWRVFDKKENDMMWFYVIKSSLFGEVKGTVDFLSWDLVDEGSYKVDPLGRSPGVEGVDLASHHSHLGPYSTCSLRSKTNWEIRASCNE